MENELELHQMIYNTLLTQISFGTYDFGDKLPTMEEASGQLFVSIDTIRAAYLRLKQEGYIKLTKNVGAIVQARYSPQETEQSIQFFFAVRKNAMIDLSQSLFFLLGRSQWAGLKHADMDVQRRMEHISDGAPSIPYAAVQYLAQKCQSLGNDLLMRLMWQIFIFLQVPFLSIRENLSYFEPVSEIVPTTLALCRGQDWDSLYMDVEHSQKVLSWALQDFYNNRITTQVPLEQQLTFSWAVYKKSSQLCYSLAMELLIAISRGQFPAGSYLPSLEKLSAEKNVSVSTVRRALSLLNTIGITRSIKRVGTLILPFDKGSENCDFTHPVFRRRLLDFIQSLQILALSCKSVSRLTLESMDDKAFRNWRQQWDGLRDSRTYDRITYITLEMISLYSPYQTIRMVYAQLLQQLFWGYPTRDMRGDMKTLDTYYASYLEALYARLESEDAQGFSEKLEELMIHELKITAELLIGLGIQDVNRLVIPKDKDW